MHYNAPLPPSSLPQATVLLAPKLSSSTLNGQLLKCLAKCQLDEQSSIRTNTNICLGKIAGYLSPSVRQGGTSDTGLSSLLGGKWVDSGRAENKD